MHDANGTPLKVSDTVLLPATITSLCTGEDYCNVSIETVHGRRPDGKKETMSAINTGVLVKFAGVVGCICAALFALSYCMAERTPDMPQPGFPRIFEPAGPRPAIAPIADWQPGDLVVFYGTNWQSRVIELATRGPSHIGGIILVHGQPLLLESTTLCDLPCEIADQPVRGVQAHTPEKRIAAYAGRVYRLPIRAKLWPEEANHLTRVALGEFIGRPYDLAGALESGTRLFKFLPGLKYHDLGSVFCSALWARLLMTVNRLGWTDATRFNPANLMRAVRRNATHGAPEPLAFPVLPATSAA